MKTNAKIEILQKCLDKVNLKYKDNIILKDVAQRGKYVKFRLGVKDSRKEGSARSWTGRRIPSACWHVHGEFIDYLFELVPEAVLYSMDDKWLSDTWYWKDKQVGSMMSPAYMSELCNC